MALKKYFLRFPPYADRKGLLTIPSLALTEYAAFIVHGEMYHHDPFFWMISREHVTIEPEGEAAYPFLVDEPVTEVIFASMTTNLRIKKYLSRNINLEPSCLTVIEKLCGALNHSCTSVSVNGTRYFRKTIKSGQPHHIHGSARDELREGPYK